MNKFDNVVVMPFALGEVEREQNIFDQAELFSDGSRHEGLPTLFASPERGSVREVVSVRRLDDVLTESVANRIDVIKLDVEGAEWASLRGAMHILKRCRPILMLEIGRHTCRAAGYEPEAFVKWLGEQGYRLERLVDFGRSEPLGTSNVLDLQNVMAYPAEVRR